jgi:neutral ceramidase
MQNPFRGMSALIISALLLAHPASLPLSAAAQERTDDPPVLAWKAGAAKVDITPGEFMWMSGYGSRDRPADGKLTDLWAKALALEDSLGHRGVVITLDLVGIDRDTAARICTALAEKYGLQRSKIMICSSHTHSGPAVGRNLRAMWAWRLTEQQRRQIDEYTEDLVDKAVSVAGDALASLQPARLTVGSGSATFAVNRRTNPEAEVPVRRVAQTLQGPSDHDVPVLAVHDAAGTLRAVMFGYACHATVLDGFQWSGDYPAHAQMELERLHPECVALFWAGCGGDQNPLPRRTAALAEHYGRRLADAVDAVVLTSAMQNVGGLLTTNYHEVELAFDSVPSQAQLAEDADSKDPYVASRAKWLLAESEAGRQLSRSYPYPIATWKLGDEIQFVALGGEAVVDYALRLKGQLKGAQTWVAAYSNDVMAYIPSRRVLAEGGYEGGGAMVYYGLPSAWSPDIENTIINEVYRQLK